MPDLRTRADPLHHLAIGAAIVAAAFLALVAVVVAHAGGHDWPEDAVVPVDRAAHTVTVSAQRDAMVWTEGGTTDCTLADARTGAPLTTRPVDASYRRPGQVSEWVGTVTVTPQSDAVAVTCGGAGTVVAVQAVPRGPAYLAGVSAWYLVPAIGGVIGAAWLLSGLRLAVRDPAARPT